jgi:hypothetical protein
MPIAAARPVCQRRVKTDPQSAAVSAGQRKIRSAILISRSIEEVMDGQEAEVG